MTDRDLVENVVSRFMTSFDTKNWQTMRRCLGDPVRVDYSDLRGEPAKATTRDAFVTARENAHGHTQTHHLISNFDICIDRERTLVKASAMIYRQNNERHFHSHALYDFELDKSSDDWLIVSIKQTILWNEGDPNLHRGVPALQA